MKFYKDEQGLPYIDLGQSDRNSAIMLLQSMELEQGAGEGQRNKTMIVQTARANYEGYSKREVLKAK